MPRQARINRYGTSRVRRRIGFILGLGLLGAAPPHRFQPVWNDIAREIDAYLSRLEGFGFSGAMLVARDGTVWLQKGYGLADRNSGSRFGQTRFSTSDRSPSNSRLPRFSCCSPRGSSPSLIPSPGFSGACPPTRSRSRSTIF